jgi:NAD+ kinase
MLGKIGVYAKCDHPDVASLVATIQERFRRENIDLLLEQKLADLVGLEIGYDGDELPGLVDLLIVLGGDGTLLSVARRAATRNVPIVGVNLGRLGFLTAVTCAELPLMLESLIAGEYTVSDRMMLDATIRRDGEVIAECCALNDIIIKKKAMARILDLNAHVDGRHLSAFRADGLIVSTATGSTGYSLAAGGPIVYPELNSLLITPICPHMLTNRPLVVWSNSVIEIEIREQNDVVFFTADGQVGHELIPEDKVEVRRSDARTWLVNSPTKDYFEILRTKLGWGES